jgi:glycosyltransferase involved in cell wall biosynthesis
MAGANFSQKGLAARERTPTSHCPIVRITFVLPAPVRIPMGGAKVVYAHAAGLAARGHEVVVVGPRRAGEGVAARAREAAVRLRDRLHAVADAPYYEAAGVRTLVVPSASARWVPDGDAVIATGAQTTPWVHTLPHTKGVKAYFIQGLETFITAGVRDTWHLQMHRITCAHWLRRAVEASGAPVLGVVPNAIDPAEFFLERPIEGRARRVVALYHRHEVKGPDVLLDVLGRLRAAMPGVEADVFAARPPSHRLPPWVRVHVRPSTAALRAIYNGAAVLLHTSRSEGWPLVPMEAAACGCAVAATANEGIREYFADGETMRAVPPGDAAALAEAAGGLLADLEARTRLAEAARRAVGQLSWETSTARFEALLQGIVGER